MLKLMAIWMAVLLLPQTEASITGRVLAENGDPLVGMEVTLVGRMTERPEVSVRTDDRGEFRLFGIKPGSYYVRARTPISIDRARYANPWQGLAALEALAKYSTVYYAQETDVARASLVEIRDGTTLTRIDFVLTRLNEYRIRGRVIDGSTDVMPAEEDGPIFFTVVRREPEETLMDTSREPYKSVGGTFELNRITPGEYWVIATKLLETTPDADGIHAVTTATEARAAVHVTDSNVENVVLKFKPK